MAKRGKKYQKAVQGLENKPYPLETAINKAKEGSFSKFIGSIDLHLGLNLPKDKDPKSIKGSVSLPNPVAAGESRIIVFCEKEDCAKAKAAGAIEAGLEDLVKKVQDGWTDFDIVLATPTTMAKIAILGKQLGPKGLMPNPKTGTLVNDIEKGISEFKKGKAKFSCDESGAIHMVIGKTDMETPKIVANARTTVSAVANTIGRPANTLLKSAVIAPTMGPGMKVELATLSTEKSTEEK